MKLLTFESCPTIPQTNCISALLPNQLNSLPPSIPDTQGILIYCDAFRNRQLQSCTYFSLSFTHLNSITRFLFLTQINQYQCSSLEQHLLVKCNSHFQIVYICKSQNYSFLGENPCIPDHVAIGQHIQT